MSTRKDGGRSNLEIAHEILGTYGFYVPPITVPYR